MSTLYFFIKKLFRYKWSLFAGIILSLILAFSSITLLSLSAWFISASAFAGLSVTTAAAFNYFIPAASIRFLALIRILSRYADRVMNHDTTFKILASLRVWFYQQLIPLAPAFLLKHRSGDLLNRIMNDIDTLDHLYLNVLSPFIIAIFIIAILTAFIAHFSIVLALIVFLFFIFTTLCLPIITLYYGKKIGSEIQNALSGLRIHVIEMLQGHVDLLLHRKESEREKILDKSHETLINAQKKYALLKGFAISTTQLLSGVTVLFVLYFGIPLVMYHTLNGALLAMIVFLVIAAFEQLLALPLATLSLGKTEHAAKRLIDISQEKPAVIFHKSNTLLDSKNSIIHFKNICFSYPDRFDFSIKDFNLMISAGEHVCITGPSGSGKTTLMHLLVRTWDPTSGTISLGDTQLRDLSEDQLREKICFITQHVHMFNASVRDNLTLMQPTISDEECMTVLKKVELDDYISSLPNQLDTLMGEFGNNFSGGQIRRIAIARALLTHASIIILDEPSTGLDHAMMQRIWNNCSVDFNNKTVIVISHDIQLAQLFKKIIHIENKAI